MNCTEFVQRFSEVHDGTAEASAVADAEKHLKGCPGCRRYRDVVTRGGELLRSLPEIDVGDDFRHRLQHRLYHVDDEEALRAHASSGTTALTALGMAVLLTAVAWSPSLRSEAPTVELDPIVVSDPPRDLWARPALLAPLALPFSPVGTDDLDRTLWDDAHRLLYQYSPVQQRYKQRALTRRAGLDRDR